MEHFFPFSALISNSYEKENGMSDEESSSSSDYGSVSTSAGNVLTNLQHDPTHKLKKFNSESFGYFSLPS